MPSVLLIEGHGADPVGDRTLRAALAAALPGYDVVSATTAHLQRAPLSRTLRETAAVVVAGETLFSIPAPGTRGRRPASSLLEAVASLAALTSTLRKPLVLLGVGAGPLPSAFSRSLARYLVRRASLLLLADHDSAEVLHAAGAASPLRISADPAWAVLGAPEAEHGPGDTVVAALDSRALGGPRGTGPRAGQEAALGTALGILRAEGLHIRLLPWAGDDSEDGGLADRLMSSLGRGHPGVDRVDPPRDLAGAREVFADAAVVLTQRFRAVHAAAEAGVPVVTAAGEVRTTALARRLGQRSVALDDPPGQIAAAVLEAAASAVPSPAAVKEEVARADAGFTLLRLVLAQGYPAEPGELDLLPLGPQPWLS